MKTIRFAYLLLFLSFSIYAQEKTFVKEYTYQASEIDSKVSSRAIATNQLRLLLLNEIGVYVESESLLKTSDISGKFTQDFVETISTISAGITSLVILEEKWDGETFWMKASITIDKEQFDKSLSELINDRRKVKDLEDLRIELDKAKKELALLTIELNSGKQTHRTQSLQEKYNDKIAVLSSTDLVYRGLVKDELQDYQGAIADYTKAIEIKHDYAEAYLYRGIAKVLSQYGNHQGYQNAIGDFSKAIEFDPNNFDAHQMRGAAKAALKDYNGAILDYTKAIEIEPDNNSGIYSARGVAKAKLQNYHGAISDLNKAIYIDPGDDGAYVTRGISKQGLQDHRGAIADLTKAIEINPQNSLAYFNRAISRGALGQLDAACKDFSKAGELGDAEAYERIKKYCN